jgi:hypothetical protein
MDVKSVSSKKNAVKRVKASFNMAQAMRQIVQNGMKQANPKSTDMKEKEKKPVSEEAKAQMLEELKKDIEDAEKDMDLPLIHGESGWPKEFLDLANAKRKTAIEEKWDEAKIEQEAFDLSKAASKIPVYQSRADTRLRFMTGIRAEDWKSRAMGPTVFDCVMGIKYGLPLIDFVKPAQIITIGTQSYCRFGTTGLHKITDVKKWPQSIRFRSGRINPKTGMQYLEQRTVHSATADSVEVSVLDDIPLEEAMSALCITPKEHKRAVDKFKNILQVTETVSSATEKNGS